MTQQETPQANAKVSKLRSWSPVWVIPIITILLSAWIVFYHFSHQGPELTLITYNAEGIEAGKTKIKSRSVDIGIVESVTLDDNFSRVVIKARLNSDMKDLLRIDSAFWIVKPSISREGVTGLGTLLSGVFIELQPGTEAKEHTEFTLLDSPSLASPDAKGIRIALISDRARQLNAGDPVLFRGYSVGSVETSRFDMNNRDMRYQLFINAPYDKLISTNVRFWKDSGIAFDMSSQGIHVKLGSISTLLRGGVSFDVPEGWVPGESVKENSEFKLFDNQSSIQNSLYTEYQNFVLFFSDSVRGLQPGAPVEFRAIRLGTVAQVPFYNEGLEQKLDNDFRIPVLIHIEPERFTKDVGADFNIKNELQLAMKNGLRASLKSGNLLTGALFVDLDFVPNTSEYKGPDVIAGYKIIPTTSGGLAQIQQKVISVLDKINNMPIELMLNQTTQTLAAGQKTIKEAQVMLSELNKVMGSKAFRNLPQELQKTLNEMNRAMQGFQPGSPAYNKMVDNMQRLDQVLREVQPLLGTLNNKSNALVFEAEPIKDPVPKRLRK